jgi:hypothetical protein
MKTLKSIFEDFYEFGDKVAFSLIDGTYFEGYPFEILEDCFTFFIGGPLAQEETIEIKFDSLDFNSLCFCIFSEHKWKMAKWNDDLYKWDIKDCL